MDHARPDRTAADGLPALLAEVRACTRCAAVLPLGPRPVLQADRRARLLIAGQAPGRRVHASGVPFDDASGDRLRAWLGVDRDTFYDPSRVAILPMGLCYPGRGSSGDLPPRPECAPAWRAPLLAALPALRLTLVIGAYAQAWHLGAGARAGVTETVRAWRDAGPALLPLPHPSPRNQAWLKHHPWFERELLPDLRERVRAALAPG
ncbi:MAG: uracil-DNA glycosylase family protein [Piscinibacter sp.]|nr:uracil-DNA glycosylase family protein [Piscinibacter sp.]